VGTDPLVADQLVALSDTYETPEDTPLVVNATDGVLANDLGAGTVSLLDDVGNGVLVLNEDGSFEYTPSPDFSGNDLFRYELTLDAEISKTSVLLTVTPVSDMPVTAEDVYWIDDPTAAFEVAADAGVLSNDTDPEGSGLTAELGEAASGELTLSEDGSFSYTGGEAFDGADSFTYTANATGGSSTSTTVRLLGPNLLDTGGPVDQANPNDLPEGFVDDQGVLCATAGTGTAGWWMLLLVAVCGRREQR